ncbi:MAG: hypothetical protein ACRYFX_20655, partial [Janthinobacterium lividum]
MKQNFIRLACLLGGLLGSSQLASAQMVYTPAAVTGYTADVIANGTGTVASSTTNTIDRGTSVVKFSFANTTFINPSGQSPTIALPANGLINSATTSGLTFQMAPATGNNDLRIDGAGSGTLTLVTPQSCNEVEVMATEGNGSAVGKTFTVTFTDGSTQIFTGVAVPDWFTVVGANPAIIVGSRVNYATDAIDNVGTNPRLFEVKLPLLAANYTKLVASVTAAKTTTDPVLNVMGISLGTTCQGAPLGGTAVATPANVCPGQSSVLSLTGATATSSISYQWQQLTGTTFVNIAGATGPTYTATPTATTQYRAVVTCSLQSTNSTAVTVTVLPTTTTLSYTASGLAATYCKTSGPQAVVTATPAGG